jgi:hypothetical protein
MALQQSYLLITENCELQEKANSRDSTFNRDSELPRLTLRFQARLHKRLMAIHKSPYPRGITFSSAIHLHLNAAGGVFWRIDKTAS